MTLDVDPLIAIFCWYYFETERFDRTLPGGWDSHAPDVWQPAGTHRQLSYRHAREARSRALAAARELGYGGEQWQWGSDRVCHWSFEHWQDLAKEPTQYLAEPATSLASLSAALGGELKGASGG